MMLEEERLVWSSYDGRFTEDIIVLQLEMDEWDDQNIATQQEIDILQDEVDILEAQTNKLEEEIGFIDSEIKDF